MEKAYDFKELGKRAKDAGLIQAEDLAEDLYKVVKDWIKDSAVLSENKIDDLVAAFIDQLDGIVNPAIDKIDGQKG